MRVARIGRMQLVILGIGIGLERTTKVMPLSVPQPEVSFTVRVRVFLIHVVCGAERHYCHSSRRQRAVVEARRCSTTPTDDLIIPYPGTGFDTIHNFGYEVINAAWGCADTWIPTSSTETSTTLGHGDVDNNASA